MADYKNECQTNVSSFVCPHWINWIDIKVSNPHKLSAFVHSGVGAMEIVAMDMKLRGMYIARQLSFKGVTFKIDEVQLTDEFKQTYNDSVELVSQHCRIFRVKRCFKHEYLLFCSGLKPNEVFRKLKSWLKIIRHWKIWCGHNFSAVISVSSNICVSQQKWAMLLKWQRMQLLMENALWLVCNRLAKPAHSMSLSVKMVN